MCSALTKVDLSEVTEFPFPTSFINHRRKENVGSVVFKFADSSSSSTVDFSRENNERLKVFLSRASGGNVTWSLVVNMYWSHILREVS